MNRKTWTFVVAGLLLALALAALVSPFASGDPDGLEKVAQDQGFMARESEEPAWKWSPWPDYWSESEDGLPTPLRKAAAGVIGTLLVFGVGYALARLAARRRASGA